MCPRVGVAVGVSERQDVPGVAGKHSSDGTGAPLDDQLVREAGTDTVNAPQSRIQLHFFGRSQRILSYRIVPLDNDQWGKHQRLIGHMFP